MISVCLRKSVTSLSSSSFIHLARVRMFIQQAKFSIKCIYKLQHGVHSVNSRYCYTLVVKDAHHHKYFGNEQSHGNSVRETWQMLKRLKSERDKLEDQGKITDFPPAATAWVTKLEFTKNLRSLSGWWRGLLLSECSWRDQWKWLFHLYFICSFCRPQLSAWLWASECCWQAGPTVVETHWTGNRGQRDKLRPTSVHQKVWLGQPSKNNGLWFSFSFQISHKFLFFPNLSRIHSWKLIWGNAALYFLHIITTFRQTSKVWPESYWAKRKMSKLLKWKIISSIFFLLTLIYQLS